MQTWLDNYIDRIINSWDWLIGPEGPVRKINGPGIADDIAAFAGTKKGIT